MSDDNSTRGDRRRAAGRGRGRPSGRGGGRPDGGGRRGGWQQADLPDVSDAEAWFTGRLPGNWFTAPVEVSVDREEIVVTGALPDVEVDDADTSSSAAGEGRAARFREETRTERMSIADQAESRYGRKVAWGVQVNGQRFLFTHLSVPVMTRLRQPERQVLDTLVDAGVARSRSEALSWAVKLVGEHTDTWLGELREAMSAVDDVRTRGPAL